MARPKDWSHCHGPGRTSVSRILWTFVKQADVYDEIRNWSVSTSKLSFNIPRREINISRRCGNGVGELPEELARTNGKTVQKLRGRSEHDMDEGSDSDDETAVGGSPGAQNYRRTFSDDDMDNCFLDGYSTRGTTPDFDEHAYPPPHWPDSLLAEYLLTHRDSWYKFAVKKGFKGRVQDLMFTRFLKRPATFVAETKEYRISEINSLPVCTAVVEAHCLGDDDSDSEDESDSEGIEYLYMCAHRLIKWNDPLDRDHRTSNVRFS